MFAFLGSVVAQTPTTSMQSPICPQVAWSCAEVTDLDAGKAGVGHRQRLRQTGLPAVDEHGQPQQFIIACGMNTDKGFLGTTGNSKLDKEYCLSSGTLDSLNYLQSKYGYSLKLQGFSNPFTSNGGNIDKTVLPSNIGESRTHMCLIGWKLPVNTTGSNDSAGENDASKDTYGLEYTTFTFPIGAAQCTSVYADPYGRTYNKDLRPVPNADVSLYDFDSKAIFSSFGIPNPVRTGIDGIFNFNVPPSKTYLQTQLPNLTDVHPNYSLAYTDPYTYGDLIDETSGNIEQRDIPVVGGGTPVLKLTGYTYLKTGNTVVIQGSASWPLTMVDLMQGNTSIMQQQSNTFGGFEFRVDPARIDPTQLITVKLTEVDLTKDPRNPAPQPATDSIVLDPIPAYLEGYAYDSKGNLLPFATIRIRLQQSDAIYYQTSADKDAYYTVAPRNVPIMPYYLEIIPSSSLPGGTSGTGGTGSAGGSGGTDPLGNPLPTSSTTVNTAGTVAGAIKVSIPVYAQQNKEYHASSAINIMAGTKNGSKVDPRAVADTSSAVFGDKESQNAAVEAKKEAQSSELEQKTQRRYVTLLIIVMLLVFIGSISVILIRKRGHHSGVTIDSSDLSDIDVYTKEDDTATRKG